MKKRSEGYFGLHFDFHASRPNRNVGGRTTPEMIREIIEKIGPDFIQCDSKGHPGFSSYATKAGTPAPGLVKDALCIWRDVAHEAGIPLVMHHSGVFDIQAIVEHPEYARMKEDGSRDRQNTSVFGKYVDERLIPQLIELAVDYGVDGVWVDGECWSTHVEYQPDIVEAFLKENGCDALPRKTDGAYDMQAPVFQAYKNYCRKRFKAYVQHYAGAVHAKAPNFEIASNWAFSSHMPELVDCPDLDFLSGDFSSCDSYNSARFEGRCLCRQGLPWDLMAWGFYHAWVEEKQVHSLKSSVSLMREAAAVISLGGGFQIYNTQLPDGRVRRSELDTMAEVAAFARARQALCQRQQPMPVDAVLYAKSDAYARQEMFVTGGQNGVRGAVRAVLDGGRPVDIIAEWQLLDRPEGRKTIIVPEAAYLSEEVIAALKQFAHDGGSLILSGALTLAMFEDIAGLKVTDQHEEVPRWIEHNGKLTGQISTHADVELTTAEAIAYAYSVMDIDDEKRHIAAAVNAYGAGKVISVTFGIFGRYNGAPEYLARDIVAGLMNLANPQPMAWLENGLKMVDIIPAQKDGKTLINLINTAGIYAEERVRTCDEIPSLYGLKIGIRRDAAPKIVRSYPENADLPYTYEAGVLMVDVERLDIHTVIVLE